MARALQHSPRLLAVGQPLGADHFFSRLVGSSFSVSIPRPRRSAAQSPSSLRHSIWTLCQRVHVDVVPRWGQWLGPAQTAASGQCARRPRLQSGRVLGGRRSGGRQHSPPGYKVGSVRRRGLRSNGGRRNGGRRKTRDTARSVASEAPSCSAPGCLRRAPIAELLAPRVVLTRPAMPMQARNCGGAA